MSSKFKEEDLSKIRPISITERRSKVTLDVFPDPRELSGNALDGNALSAMMPPVLKGADLPALTEAIGKARDNGKAIVWMIGAHVIKCGLSRYLDALMERRLITAICTTGSATIHDIEIAQYGKTSEDVGEELPKGRFGMARETAEHFAAACDYAARSKLGLGEGVGAYLLETHAPNAGYSVFAAAARHGIPATVHVALGTDITHQHPSFPSATVGELSMRDFRIFSSLVGDGFDQGVFIVFGSAVVLPEVFLKAVSIGYNLKKRPKGIVTASFDMLPQYRVRENVLGRPFRDAGVSYSFIGHHEIMLPLLYFMLERR